MPYTPEEFHRLLVNVGYVLTITLDSLPDFDVDGFPAELVAPVERLADIIDTAHMYVSELGQQVFPNS